MEYQEKGGKKHKKTRRLRPNILVVKVYADWCGHCKSLEPEWDRMKKIVPMHKVRFVEINEKHKDAAIPHFNMTHGVELPQPQGYPTIARFGPDKQIQFYDGERRAKPLAKWALNGGQSTEGGSKKRHRNRTAKKSRGTRGLLGWLGL
jgi:hypothetical protein